MRIKLVDFLTNEYETTFGTCDLCMRTGLAVEETFVFEVDGKIVSIDNYYWSYGTFFTALMVDNVVDFADWLNKTEFEDGFKLRNFKDLYELDLRYNK